MIQRMFGYFPNVPFHSRLWIFGDRIKTVEELVSTVFINEMRAIYRLKNRAKIPYLSRLVELKNVRWTTEVKN
jgi:hypothetical protein